MFKRMLVAYDGSNGAWEAIEKAAKLANITGAEILVLTVYRHHSMLEASLSMVRGSDREGGSLDDTMRAVAREAAEAATTGTKPARSPSLTAASRRFDFYFQSA